MASAKPLENLAENFLQCSICLNEFREPKVLKCLHRYCSECLKNLIESSGDGKVKCPLCAQITIIPSSGLKGLQTDFHMKSMLEFIRLQKHTNLNQCRSCLRDTKTSGCCSKCKTVMCEECHEDHINHSLCSDPEVPKSQVSGEGELTSEKLVMLEEKPRCHVHEEEYVTICCNTCQNEPVCFICTHSTHRGHDFDDVADVANKERMSLRLTLSEINNHKNKLSELPKQIEMVKQKLRDNNLDKSNALEMQHQTELKKVTERLEKHRQYHERGLENIECKRQNHWRETDAKFQRELNKLNQKYDQIRKLDNKNYDDDSKTFKNKCEKKKRDLCKKVERLGIDLTELKQLKNASTKRNEDELQRMSDYYQQTIEKCDNFIETASSILSSNNEWTAVQCIPDIILGSKLLVQGLKNNKIPDLDALSDFELRDLIKPTFDVTISTTGRSVFDIVEGNEPIHLGIAGVASCGDDNIVVTGKASAKKAHVTVINRKGQVIRRDEMTKGKTFKPYGLCCALSRFKTVAVPVPDRMCIYDIRDGSYYEKNVEDIIHTWPSNKFVASITFDHTNNEIILGTNSNDLYVLDDRLNYSRMLKLPNIKLSRDITLHQSNLIVCDYNGKGAYLVSMKESQCEMIHEFSSPGGRHCDDWRPLSVCTDKNMFIYILWRGEISNGAICILTQYNDDGRKLLKRVVVDEDARCITVVGAKESENESLLLATYEKGKIYFYPLIDDDEDD